MNILSVGEILWDLVDGEERLGGAPFNFAAQAARLGENVAMISAVGEDDRGRRALARAEQLGVDTRWLQTTDAHPTGHVTVTLQDGQPDYVIHRPAAYDDIRLSDADLQDIRGFAPDWVYFGTLHQVDPRPRETHGRILSALPDAKRFYDVNLRKDSYSAALLSHLLPLADALKINDDEVREVSTLLGLDAGDFAAEAARRFGLETVCITRGGSGCSVWSHGETVESAGYSVEVADAVGAGDAFAAAFLHALGGGRSVRDTADFANRVGAVIASKAGAIPMWEVAEALAL